MPGKIYTPDTGSALPAVVFGHDWMTGVHRYHQSLKHLASWGIVAAAPDTERGFNPNHEGFSTDLQSCLEIISNVPLGKGKIIVSPGKLGLIGHGMGASCAVLAAENNPNIRAVAALYPSVTQPDATEVAKKLNIPGLVIGSDSEPLISAGDPEKLARNWNGSVVYRVVEKATQNGFSEGILTRLLLGMGLPQIAQQERTRALLTGFLLHTLNADKKYAAFASGRSEAKHVSTYTKGALLAKESTSSLPSITRFLPS